MGIIKSKNKWLIGLSCLAVILIVLWAFDRYSKQKRDQQLSYNCKNKIWYDIPDMQFKGYKPAEKTEVTIKRKGQAIQNKLQLKESGSSNTVTYQLTAVDTATAVINKNDTVLITLGNEKYAIYGFKSNSYYTDHHILDCDDQYQMNGKPFRSKELNWIHNKQP